MKLKTRIALCFTIIVAVPIILSVVLCHILIDYQSTRIERKYGISETRVGENFTSMELYSRMTEDTYNQAEKMASKNPKKLHDLEFLNDLNQELKTKQTYLMVTKGENIIYMGKESAQTADILNQVSNYRSIARISDAENGLYIGGTLQVLVKQIHFIVDGQEEILYFVTDVSRLMPDIQKFIHDMLLGVLILIMVTAAVLSFWLYHSITKHLRKMQDATQMIKMGNLDFVLKPDVDDELGTLEKDLEEMRQRLQASAEEKIKFDKESKELISNISHDLKTPVTAIKGYAEGIMDGVSDTPEKMDKYIHTIYNKANEMDLLINELTLYSKIDTNRIPYNFSTISANEYFNDCAEDLSFELESKNVDFNYQNFVDDEVKIIADAEQIRRVIHNIVNNSVKYMDKDRPKINLRVRDVGDFVQVEIEDNGKGIGSKELPHIFERFYRTDTSRNSSKGGSGIGLSIVKKIIEEHGGKIWATSKEKTGTTMIFVLRKYQEGPYGE